MIGKSTHFSIFLLVGALFLSLPAFHIGTSSIKERIAADRNLAKTVRKQQRELDRVRGKLRQAMGLLDRCFGQQVELDRIRSTAVTITAYSSTRDQCDATPYLTASKTPVRVGILAVSPDLLDDPGLSYGQRVLIPGYGLFEVRDLMNPRWHRRVDIWEGDTEAAKRFGKRKGTLIWLAEKEARPQFASTDSE